MTTGPTMVPWTEVYPDDQVAGADGAAWTVLDRQRHGDRIRVTIVREGRDPISRLDPPGAVLCHRGEHGRQVAAAVDVFRGCGFVVG